MIRSSIGRNLDSGPGKLTLVIEFSYKALATLPDYSREIDHADELARYVRALDHRGVFSRVCAEVKGERFDLSRTLSAHLSAFASKDKPFYKMCQGASYLHRTAELLQMRGRLSDDVQGRVIAVTSAGYESVSADCTTGSADFRLALLESMSTAYRTAVKVGDEDAERRLGDEMKMVFTRLMRALPIGFHKQVKQLTRLPAPGGPVHFEFEEQVEGYHRPDERFTVEEAVDHVISSPTIDEFLGHPARQAIGNELAPIQREGTVTLRDLHSAAVVTALKGARRGVLNVIALEGNPGIGKTTAVGRYLRERLDGGFLCLYLSPRVVINKDVTRAFARGRDGSASGILTATSNAELIRNAAAGYRKTAGGGHNPARRVDSAVLIDGVNGLVRPELGNIWYMTPAEEATAEVCLGRSGFKKEALDERRDQIRQQKSPGVLRTLASGTRKLLECNAKLDRIVLTAAIQGYRNTQAGTTISGLDSLFENEDPMTRAGKAERSRLATRIPNVIVMLDEVAGDGAGALLVDGIAKWVDEQFFAPFGSDKDGSPFKGSLVISDASLGNETVLESYLASRPIAPEKVLISSSSGNHPFKLACTRFVVGAAKRDVLHVMTNSFPASRLDLRFRIKLHRMTPEVRDDGTQKSVRERIQCQGEAILLESAREEVETALAKGAAQIIFFAQSKEFLSRLREVLVAPASSAGPSIGPSRPLPDLRDMEVAILDSSVSASKRQRLISEPERDRIKVFLMTSSGARGVSFPKADVIVAAIPRFNVESNLMEVAQLIYRGRGTRRDPATGQEVSGDGVARKLVMLVDDFLPEELLADDPRSWLRRSSDLLTLVMMLRGTILTRIKGDAGLPGKNLAIVPVGLIGSQELLVTMSQAVQTFLREGELRKLRAKSERQRSLVTDAIKATRDLFSTYTLQGVLTDHSSRTYADSNVLAALVQAVTAPMASLLLSASEQARIPDTSFCIGPFWLEDWSAVRKDEIYSFGKSQSGMKSAETRLKNQLIVIHRDEGLPSALRRSARDLRQILDRDQSDENREFSTVKSLDSKATWLTLPLNYPQFFRPHAEDDGEQKVVREAEEWQRGLAGAFQVAGTIIPVIPHYKEFPWAACLGVSDPSRFRQVFDDRYFMASTELNLLNTILLAESEGKEGEAPTP